MRQFVLPGGYQGEGSLVLRGRDFHYLREVLRLPVGSEFPGIDHHGARFSLRLVAAARDSCTVMIEPAAAAPSPGDAGDTGAPSPESNGRRTNGAADRAADGTGGGAAEARPARITLFQCLPKGSKMDLIVRQATEAGVYRIVPVMSERSVPRVAPGESGKSGRWSRIVREALQQSGNLHPPLLDLPIRFDSIPDQGSGADARIFFHPGPLAHKTLHEYLLGATEEIALVVGPEGGLSEREVALLVSAGFGGVYLGKNILRAETAALYAIAAVQMVLLERDSWKARPRSNA